MFLYDNLLMLMEQLKQIIYSPFNRLLILACSSQIASMIVKMIIASIRAKNISLESMANYGGMPSSHTVFIASFVFGTGLDPAYGWQSPLFTLSLILSAVILMDTVRFRGTVDRINQSIKLIIENNKNINKSNIELPRMIAHKPSEIIGGLVFAFLYTFTFYLFFYRIFENLSKSFL